MISIPITSSIKRNRRELLKVFFSNSQLTTAKGFFMKLYTENRNFSNQEIKKGFGESGFKRRSLGFMLLLISILFVGPLLAQDAAAPDDTSKNAEAELGPDGKVEIESYLVDDFENSALWYGEMEIDDGLVTVRRVYGGPQELKDADAQTSQFALGAKIQFLRRSFSQAAVEPPRPVRIPGLTQKFSVWVNGKGLPHKLYAIILDFKGEKYKIPFGELNFTGWQKMEAPIPSNVDQESKAYQKYFHRQGITFVSFLIEFSALDAIGSYYVYFDNLSAETNTYVYKDILKNDALPSEERVDPIDNW